MTILRVLIRRSLTTEPYQCGPSQIPSNLRNYSVQELPEGHELDFVAKQMVGCVHWNVVTYRQSPVAIDSDGDSTFDDDYTLNEAQLGRDYCRAISHVLSVRMRLSEVAESRWRTELHLTVETLKDTFDAVLNHVWNSAAAGGILPMKSDQELITWSVNIHAALVTTDNVEAGGNGFVEFRARRKKFDNGSRWTLWRTKEAVVEALFGLWMSQLQQHQPPVPETGDNLWLVNIDGLGGNNLGHVLCDWWISRDIDSIDVDHLNHIRNDYSIHPSRILNCITDGDTPSLAMQGIIGRSTLPQMCAQYILSAFLAAVLVAIKPITSETKFEPIKGKRHLKLVNNDIQDLAERIEASGLASLDDAYRIVITALFRANKLPDILNNARAILQQSKRFSTSEIAEEGHFSGVCGRIRCLFSHKVDTLITQQSAWREAGEASRDLMRAFVEVMGPEDRETALMRQSVGEVSKRLEIPQGSIVPLLPNLSDEPENFNITLDAIRNNQVNQIHHFLQHNNFFNLDDICDEGKTPLGLATSEGNIAFVRLFLFYGAKPTIYDANKQTPLHLAVDIASHGFDPTMVQIATLLLLNGANVNGVQEVQNWSPLDAAVSYGSNEIIQILIQNGADMNLRNEENMTALLWAVRNGRGEAVGLLLEKGAHLHAKDNDDKTALHLAAEMGHGNVLELLLAKGLGLHLADKIDKTALHWAAEGGHAACVELLITNGADVRSGDIDDKTALHWAAGQGHKAAVSALIAGGSDIDSKDRDGKTAMHWAAENGHKAAVRALIENGASLQSEDQGGRTALHWAARMGNETVVKLLVENRVDLDTKDLGGRTAMHWAALRGHAAVVSLLAREGADLHIEDLAGQTARKWAARRGHNAVVGLLMQTDQISSRRNSL